MSEEQIAHIENILMRRYWLFGAMILSITICAFAIWGNARAITGISKRMDKQDSEAAKHSALIEAAISQQVVFQTTLAQIMDKMSKDNPKVKVPRVPVRPPKPPVQFPPNPSSPPEPEYSPTDAELTRKQSNGAVTQQEQTEHKSKPTRKRSRARPTPTPKPWYNFFKTTR